MINELKKRWYSSILIVLGALGALYAVLNFAPYLDYLLIILTTIAFIIALVIFFTPIKELAKKQEKTKKILSGILLVMAISGFIYSIISYNFMKFDMLLLIMFIISSIIIILLYFEPISK